MNLLKNIYLLLIVVVLLLTMGGIAGANILEIDSCQNITGSGSYTLMNNLISSGELDCITISANNVSFEAQNYSITNYTNQSFYIHDSNNITISNLIINNGTMPIMRVNNSLYNNILIYDNNADYVGGQTAVWVVTSNNNLFKNIYINYSQGNPNGFMFDHGNNNTVYNSTIKGDSMWAVYNVLSTNLTIQNTDIKIGNTANDADYYLYESSLLAQNNNISDVRYYQFTSSASALNQTIDNISFIYSNVSNNNGIYRHMFSLTNSNISFEEKSDTNTVELFNFSGLKLNTEYLISNQSNKISDNQGRLNLSYNISSVNQIISLVEYIPPNNTAPIIQSWSNDNTTNGSLSFTVPKNTNITFNVTSDLIIDSWVWVGATELNGSGLNTSYAYHNFSASGIITVHGINTSNGSTQTITWTVGVISSFSGYILNIINEPIKSRVTTNDGYTTVSDSTTGLYLLQSTFNPVTITVEPAVVYRKSTASYPVNNSLINVTVYEKSHTSVVASPGLPFTWLIIITILVYWLRKQKR